MSIIRQTLSEICKEKWQKTFQSSNMSGTVDLVEIEQII